MTTVQVRLEAPEEQDVRLAAKQLGIQVSRVKPRDDSYQLYGSYEIRQPSNPVMGPPPINLPGAPSGPPPGFFDSHIAPPRRPIHGPKAPGAFDFSGESTENILTDLRSREAAGREDDETKALRAEMVRRASQSGSL